MLRTTIMTTTTAAAAMPAHVPPAQSCIIRAFMRACVHHARYLPQVRVLYMRYNSIQNPCCTALAQGLYRGVMLFCFE